jgi:hypothetical protein
LVKDYIKKYKVSSSTVDEVYGYVEQARIGVLYKNGATAERMLALAKKDRDTKKFAKLIKKYIDKGTPLMWSMTTGIHAEFGTQSGNIGGHMRTIIGYNEKTGEILYSDTWGKGHELKRWSTEQVFTVTSSIYELRPR